MLPAKRTRDTLWTLIVPPTVWGWHFLISYVAAAFVCAPNNQIFEGIGGVRAAIAILTVAALAVIAWAGRRAYREWQEHEGGFTHDEDTPRARETFLEFSTLLLACLSFVAVIFTALPVLLIADCR